MRELKFIDGSRYIVDEHECRGCFMNKNEVEMPECISPIYEKNGVVIRQDAEWPIPAFYIISIRDHIGSIADLDMKLCYEIIKMTKIVRMGLRDLFEINNAQIYHEEKINAPHFHLWLLPLWNEEIKKNNLYPKIYESNVKKYIDLFDYDSNKNKIIECNYKMKEYIERNIEKYDI